MQPTLDSLRAQLRLILDDKTAQGHQTEGLYDELDALSDGYDDLAQFAEHLADLPMREDWPHVEPNDLDAIWAECDPDRPTGMVDQITPEEAARRAEAAFLSPVCGCMLGKPLEIRPTLHQNQRRLSPVQVQNLIARKGYCLLQAGLGHLAIPLRHRHLDVQLQRMAGIRIQRIVPASWHTLLVIPQAHDRASRMPVHADGVVIERGVEPCGLGLRQGFGQDFITSAALTKVRADDVLELMR